MYTNITFSCSNEFVLTGPTAATCTENGTWKPNPEEVDCKGCEINNNCMTKLIFRLEYLIIKYIP